MQVTGAQRIGCAEAKINWLLIDSRSLCFPEETLFFALKTSKNDGHRYVEGLYRRGVRNFVVSRQSLADGVIDAQGMADANFLAVDSPLHALQALAAHHRDSLNIPVIGITGSNGKTTVKEWLYQLLSPDYSVCRSPRSYNSQVGVPLSVWLMNSHNELAIIETGISEPGEMERLAKMVRPTIGVMTNLGVAHQENFMTYDIKCSEKMQLFKGCETVVINSKNTTIQCCASMLPESVNRFALNVTQVEKKEQHAVVHFEHEGKRGQYMIRFVDDAAIDNSIT